MEHTIFLPCCTLWRHLLSVLSELGMLSLLADPKPGALAAFSGCGMVLPHANTSKASCNETKLEIVFIITIMEMGIQLRELN